MLTKLHKNARTTIAIRKYIKNSKESVYALAKKFNLSWNTVYKWKNAKNLEDKSSRPHKLNTTLTRKEEELICFERKQFKKSIDEIYFSLKDKIKNLYPMKIYRCLRRYGLDSLPTEFIKEERKIKKFKNYGIGYLHIDTLYSPKINKQRYYILTSIDRVSKIAYLKISITKGKASGEVFLKEVLRFYPYKINYILTDNGGEFSYNFLPKEKRTNKIHPFDKLCQQHKIKHRTIKFKHPWTNGMVERFNKRIKDKVLKKYRFSSIFELKEKLLNFIDDYNHNTRLKTLNYKTPAEYLKETKDIILQRIVS